MSCLPDMTPMSLAAALVSRTGKIIKHLQNGVFKLSQSSEIVLQS